MPTEVSKLKEYKNKVPIFTKFGIEEQLAMLYQPILPLPSGGYIVINPTEALISIDVNSGKATSERNIEETALKTNLEAAKEIARQVRLRDLSGLVVIDFIDMGDTRNRKIVERSFREFLSRDRARIQTANISQFGLLEMSRQRLRLSFSESNSSICSYCNGKGLVRADESNAMLILRTVENEIYNDNIHIINVYANSNAVIYLLNNKRSEIALIEEKYGLKLNFYVDSTATSDNYSIEKVKLPKKSANLPVSNIPLLQNQSTNYLDEKNNQYPSKNKQKWKTTSNNSESINNRERLSTEQNINRPIKNKEQNSYKQENKSLEKHDKNDSEKLPLKQENYNVKMDFEENKKNTESLSEENIASDNKTTELPTLKEKRRVNKNRTTTRRKYTNKKTYPSSRIHKQPEGEDKLLNKIGE